MLLLGLATTARAAALAYIPNSGSNTVSVIDTTSNAVIRTVAVGTAPRGVAVDPAGRRAYVTNQNSNTVSVIDVATNTVMATVTVGAAPFGVAVNPAGSRAYIARIKGVDVIETASNVVIASVALTGAARGVAVDPTGTRVYVANSGYDAFVFCETLTIIDALTNTVTGSVSIGSFCGPEGSIGFAVGVAVDPTGTRVYVTDNVGGAVSVVDPATRQVIRTLFASGARAPFGIAVHPLGTFVYVANEGIGTVSVINVTTNQSAAEVPVGAAPNGVAIDAAGKRVYVASKTAGTVSVIDTTTNTVVATISVGTGPIALGRFLSPEPGPLCEAQVERMSYATGDPVRIARLRLANTATTARRTEMKVWLGVPGAEPRSAVNMGGDGSLSLPAAFESASTSSDLFTVTADLPRGTYELGCRMLDPDTGGVLSEARSPFAIGPTPASTAPAAPAAAYLYVANYSSNDVSVIDTSSNKLMTSVPVSGPSGVGAHPSVPALYVTATKSISVLPSGPQIAAGDRTTPVIINAAGTRAYFATSSWTSDSSSVVTVDTTTHAPISAFPLPFTVEALALNTAGTRLYAVGTAAGDTRGRLVVVDTATNQTLSILSLEGLSRAVAVSPSGDRVYVASNLNLFGLNVVDTETNQVVATVRFDEQPSGASVAVSPAGTRVYTVTARGVAIIDAKTNAVLTAVTIDRPTVVLLTEAGDRLYVVNGTNVSVVDTATGSVTATIPVGRQPLGLAIGPKLLFAGVNPICRIDLTQTSYTTGDAVTASSFRLANPSNAAKPVELKLWLGTPDSDAVSMANLGADGSLTLPPGFDSDPGPVALFTVSSALPRGRYEVNCRMLHPVTGGVLIQDLNPFSIR